ncbi:MAG: PDZ domain-containing protein [Planctomycetes bacterium]|nr:PDZ domain-containing protein [Planctomycetota bacterium]
MGRFGLMVAGAIGLALPLAAQGITIKSKDGTVESHGEAKKAEPGDTMARPESHGDGESLSGFLKEVDEVKRGTFAAGDLTEAEINALEKKAREKLEKDMKKLQERERENAAERDPEDKAEEALDIKKDRYRASLRALERDLLFNCERMREASDDKLEGEMDDLSDKIRDTFADLHDKIEDGMPAEWDGVLSTARKFHTEYSAQINKWADKVGVSSEVPNAKERVTDMKKALRARVKRLRKIASDKYQDQLDDVEERILATYEGLEDKLDDADPKAWAQILKDADKFMLNYTAELDGWAKKIGGDETLPSPLERLGELNRDIDARVKDLRRIGGDEYEDAIDEIAERVDDVFAELKDKILEEGKDQWPDTLEVAAKYHKQFCDTIDMWQRKIVGATDKIDRKLPPVPEVKEDRPEYPEKDVPLAKGEQMDIVEGVRVARLMPMPKKQLGLDHGLSVNEIVDSDKPLARARLEVYDIILAVNGKDVDTRTELRDALAGVEKGAEYEIKILRDGAEKTLKAKK